MTFNLNLWKISGWIFGLIAFAIGVVNTFWGNDPFFGLFIIGLSFVYFPPANDIFERITSWSVPMVIKILLGIFILWAALGVGELFDKVDMMLMDFSTWV